MGTFNGHKNWNHWNVSLWINNEESLYRLAKECINETDNRTEAARLFIRDVGVSKTPDGAPFSVSAVRAAMVGM